MTSCWFPLMRRVGGRSRDTISNQERYLRGEMLILRGIGIVSIINLAGFEYSLRSSPKRIILVVLGSK